MISLGQLIFAYHTAHMEQLKQITIGIDDLLIYIIILSIQYL